MPIIKIKRDNKYAQIANTTLRDKRLSLDTRGFLGEMLSYSEDFEVSVEWLLEHFDIGREKLLRFTTELKEFGYLKIPTSTNEHGKFTGKEWFFYGEPEAADTAEEPRCGKTVSRLSRSTGNPHDSSKQDSEELESFSIEKDSSVAPPTLAEKGKRFFSEFTELMTRHGSKESNARSALGKLKKTYGEEIVYDAYWQHSALLETKAGGAFEYFVGILKRQKADTVVALTEAEERKEKEVKREALLKEKADFFMKYRRDTYIEQGLTITGEPLPQY